MRIVYSFVITHKLCSKFDLNIVKLMETVVVSDSWFIGACFDVWSDPRNNKTSIVPAFT